MEKRVLTGLAALTLGLAVSNCVLAAAGAGAGGAVYLTSRGVESMVAAPVGRAFSATERAFHDFDVKRTSLEVEDDNDRRVVKGKSGDEEKDVTVTLESEGKKLTRVEVIARTSALTWDKDYARAILEKIVELSS